jgi:hypothetical protein
MKRLKENYSDTGSESDDEIEKRRKLREKQAQQKLTGPGNRAGLLSGNMRLMKSTASAAAAASIATSGSLKKRLVANSVQ